MARTLFFLMVLRKLSEITNNKPIFSQYNIFYNYEYFLFQSALWSLFNHRQRSQSNQEQGSLCCRLPCFLVLLCSHYMSLQCFSTYFCKLKEIGVLRPIFPDYVISCDYDHTKEILYVNTNFMGNQPRNTNHELASNIDVEKTWLFLCKIATAFFSFFSVWVFFLSRTFTIRRIAGKGGGYRFNSSLPLPPASQTRRH